MISTWDVDRVERLRSLTSQGLSMGDIAKRMHLTRNAVIGKLSRLGLSTMRPQQLSPEDKAARLAKRRRVDAEAKRIRRTDQPVKTNRIYLAGNGTVRPVYEFPTQPDLRCVEVEPLHLSIAGLTFNSCRYPFGNGPFTFCGHEQLFGSSYCAEHMALCGKQAAA